MVDRDEKALRTRRFFDTRGNEVPYDGISPITWTLRASVLAVRGGKALMVRQPPKWGGRWELPGGSVEPAEPLLEAAERECYEETGYRFVSLTATPFHLAETWYRSSRGTYLHAVIVTFQGDVSLDRDPGWRHDHTEIVQIAWMAPADLTEGSTRAFDWPVLQRAGLI